MPFRKTLLAAVALGGLVALGPSAQAAYTITVTQQGNNVVATGSGSLNLTALGSPQSASWSGELGGTNGFAFVGPDSNTDVYSGFSGPTNFGTGSGVFATSNSGTITGIFATGNAIYVPTGYIFGTALSGSSTWDNTTIATLGLTPDTYTWNWGTGATADSFTVIIGGASPVPEPASLALLLLPATLLPLLRIRRRGVAAV